MSPLVQTHIVRSELELRALAEEWRALYLRANRSLFSDYDWFAIWWDCLGKTDPANRLHVVTLRRQGQPVALRLASPVAIASGFSANLDSPMYGSCVTQMR